MKLKNEKMVDSALPVMNDWMRLWSPMRCRMSPMFFTSKKCSGSFISFIRKSDISVMLTRAFMCSVIQLCRKFTPVCVTDNTSWAMSISVIRFRLL